MNEKQLRWWKRFCKVLDDYPGDLDVFLASGGTFYVGPSGLMDQALRIEESGGSRYEETFGGGCFDIHPSGLHPWSESA